MYYVGSGKDGQIQTSTKPCNAALMTEALAELLVTKLNITGHHAEVCELLADETSTIHDSLVDIGEEVPPPAAPPTSVVESSHAVMGVGSHARMRLTLDYTQGCTLGGVQCRTRISACESRR